MPGTPPKGAVALTVGVDLRDRGDYLVTSPPAIVDDLVVGSAIGDNRAIESESTSLMRRLPDRAGDAWAVTHRGSGTIPGIRQHVTRASPSMEASR